MVFARSAAAVCVWLAFTVSAHAQASNPVINRANVPPGYATPTGGTFSIRFPIAFIDMAQTGDNFGADPDMVVRMVTGKTEAGIRLSASELPDPKGKLASVETFMDNLKRRLGTDAVLSDVSRDRKNDMETSSFALAAHQLGFYFRVIRVESTEYILLVQFPEAQRDTATGVKDAFFDSFSLARP
jgi:hypothetical protein